VDYSTIRRPTPDPGFPIEKYTIRYICPFAIEVKVAGFNLKKMAQDIFLTYESFIFATF
jgi:hypothetical protein